MTKIEEQIKEYFTGKTNSPSSFYKAIKTAPKEIIEYCEQILKANSNWEKLSFVILGILRNQTLPKCQHCGKEFKWSKRNCKFCSNSCAQSNQTTLNKIEQTNIKKYGVIRPILLNKFKEKRKQTNLEKYGVESPISLNLFKEKRKETCLKKYGTDTPAQNIQIQEKTKQTCLTKYGVEYTGSLSARIEKAKQTNIKRYGTEIPAKTNLIKEKTRQTNLFKYNVDSPSQLEQFKQKSYDKSWTYITNFLDYVEPQFTRDEYHGQNHEYLWKCKKCGNIFKQRIYSTSCFPENQYIPRCLKCYPHDSNLYRSVKEIEIANFCKKFYPDLKENNRQLINPYELDIVITDIKLAIEFNGTYWHSFQCNPDKNYHLTKTQLCQTAGYRLIQIMQNDFDKNKDKILTDLEKILIKQEVIPARLCYDRFWYSINQFQNYKILPPEVLQVDRYHIVNSGYIVLN